MYIKVCVVKIWTEAGGFIFLKNVWLGIQFICTLFSDDPPHWGKFTSPTRSLGGFPMILHGPSGEEPKQEVQGASTHHFKHGAHKHCLSVSIRRTHKHGIPIENPLGTFY